MSAHRATFVVPPDHPTAAGHFPGNPVVPAVMLLECVVLATRQALAEPVEFSEIPNVKFLHPVAPGTAFQVELHVDRRRGEVRFRCVADGRDAAQGRALFRHAR